MTLLQSRLDSAKYSSHGDDNDSDDDDNDNNDDSIGHPLVELCTMTYVSRIKNRSNICFL